MFSRIANLFKGFLSLFVSGVERRNPEALLELEQENLRKQIGNFNQGLASHAGLAERRGDRPVVGDTARQRPRSARRVVVDHVCVVDRTIGLAGRGQVDLAAAEPELSLAEEQAVTTESPALTSRLRISASRSGSSTTISMAA